MQVEGTGAGPSTGKLSWQIRGGLSLGVPRTHHRCVHTLMPGVGVNPEGPGGLESDLLLCHGTRFQLLLVFGELFITAGT